MAALAGTIAVLIASRAIQDVGGGGLIILVCICRNSFFNMHDRGTCRYLRFLCSQLLMSVCTL